jgi:hypothetical protein
VLPNAARSEYWGLVGGCVRLTAGVKIYGAANTTAFKSNRWTTNISNLFLTDELKVNKGYVSQRKAFETVLRNELAATEPRVATGTIRLVFDVSQKMTDSKSPQLEVVAEDHLVGDCKRTDIVFTFTRSSLSSFFADSGLVEIINSLYSRYSSPFSHPLCVPCLCFSLSSRIIHALILWGAVPLTQVSTVERYQIARAQGVLLRSKRQIQECVQELCL